MPEIDIAEDEARQQRREEAVARGDLRCDFKITLKSTVPWRYRYWFAFFDDGWILVQQEWTIQQIKSAVVSAVKQAYELRSDYEVVAFSYTLQPYLEES
ncbi:MAG: hypothetical protein JWM07_850 [Candidatus Saccharibacteria bacterium]|nr:hypothetical protein [Candidatus Saccharibacteria bacterium]